MNKNEPKSAPELTMVDGWLIVDARTSITIFFILLIFLFIFFFHFSVFLRGKWALPLFVISLIFFGG